MEASKKKFGNQLKPKTANPLMKAFKSSGGDKAVKNAVKSSGAGKTISNAVKSSGAANTLKSAMPKSSTSKAAPSRPLTPKAAPATGNDAMKKLKSFTSGKKLGEEISEFDIIIEHLIEQGFPVDEALKLMVNMSEEKREQILETTRRQQDNASGAPMKEETVEEGMHREADTGKVVDKAEVGKTYYPNMPKKKSSVALRKEKEAAEKKKQKTHKEEMDSLMAAYQFMFVSEEEADKLRDQRQERGGVDGNTRYDKAPKASGTGKKKAKDTGMSAFDKVVADLKGKYGDKAVMARKTEKKKED